MRTRMLFCASAIALLAASCSQPEPHVLSEAPRATTATDLTSVTETSEREPEPGRFIARCATEADGGTPGMTMFTDGSQAVTDHCLSRYYIGVQPAPGALYVPDEDAGTYAPTRETETRTEPTTTYQWTPAQPRTDAGPDDGGRDDESDSTLEELDPESGTDTDEGSPDGTESTTTPEETSETSPATTTPGEPGETTTPGTTEPTSPEATEPTTPGSSEPTPTTEVPVPTVTETPGTTQAPPETPVTSTAPPGPQAVAPQNTAGGSRGSANVPGSQGSAGSHDPQGHPFPFGSLDFAPPTAVQTAPAPVG